PQLDELWAARIHAMGLPEEMTDRLLDPGYIDDMIAQMPPDLARNVHACTHTTFSPNVISGGVKTNVIPDEVTVEVDIRILPGETAEDVDNHLEAALGDLGDQVEIEAIQHHMATSSPIDTPLWHALAKATAKAYPEAVLVPSLITGGTDSRFFRERGAVAYGAGLLSPAVDAGEFSRRFHGHNERIDIESLRLTIGMWLDVVEHLWA
ncbi:MAG: M20/M25/M40 family metallo-hydrolase, partial [Acidimicrobiia bacterium]|nr:M20/M25/M40 family metallo-hydrolase [Acidimicrobiia bacterium]